MKRKHIYILLALLCVGFVSYWFTRGNKVGPADTGTSGQGRSSGRLTVNAQVIGGQTYSNTITLSGTIEPDEQVQIRSEIPGVIRELAFNEGTYVEKGQLLIRTDDSELQALLIQAETREKLNAENERRARQLLEKEAISSQEYDVARADHESARAQTALIKAQLAKTRVLAPFSGHIGLRSVSVGEYLTPTTVVANLVNIKRVKILFSVPEKYSGIVKVGHPLQFTSGNGDKQYDARIYAIEPGVDAATRTIQIRAVAPNPGGELFPGAFARIVLPLDRLENAILIPTYSVIPVQDGKQVYLFKDGAARMVNVSTESRTSYDVVVTEGIRIGDTLITSGLMSIQDGMKVDVRILEQAQNP